MNLSFACRLCSSCCLCMAVVFSAASALADGADPAVADFSGGVSPVNWTVENGEYRSPDYDAAVDRIELRYNSTGANGSVAVYASSTAVETQVATFSAASTAASFDFPETTDFRSFRIATTNGLSLLSFAAYVSASEIEPPEGVVISNNTTGTSFDASWNPVAGATGYRVYVWTNVVDGASAGEIVWKETMPGATNASANTRLVNEKFTDCFEHPGWTRSEKAGYPTGEDGTIRIGIEKEKGWLQTPPLDISGSDLLLRFCAKAKVTNTKSMDIAIERVSNEVTNVIGTATLTTEMQEYTVLLPEWERGDSIRINSLTNVDRRVIIGSVAIVLGCSSGQEAYIIDGLDVGEATSCLFADQPSVPVFFAVKAYGKRGVTSSMSGAVEVDLSNPDKVAVLNACPISSLEKGSYAQYFDSLAAFTSTTGDKEWLNGTTLLYWQAYKDSEAATSIKWNGGGGATNGLYALSLGQGDLSRALGAYSTKETEFSFGIAFTNDTDSAMILSSVAYSAQQWGFGNTTNQTLSVSAQVVDSLDWISAFNEGWTTLAETKSGVFGKENAHITPESTPVLVNPESAIRIAPGQVLMIKWTVHSLNGGKPGMMAIDDVAATFVDATLQNVGFSIRLANRSIHP